MIGYQKTKFEIFVFGWQREGAIGGRVGEEGEGEEGPANKTSFKFCFL